MAGGIHHYPAMTTSSSIEPSRTEPFPAFRYGILLVFLLIVLLLLRSLLLPHSRVIL